MHQTIQNQLDASALSRKVNSSLEQLQLDINQWMDFYNYERTHPGGHTALAKHRGRP